MHHRIMASRLPDATYRASVGDRGTSQFSRMKIPHVLKAKGRAEPKDISR
ncbi:MAG: hypothetical protein KTR29_03400 [Rhodothermaceae bacterium]|nr:hypothetical protein [Rhodothermaceae bacterium]